MKRVSILLSLTLLALTLFAQDAGSLSFSFDTGSLEVKSEIIQELMEGEKYNPILIQSLEYIEANAKLFQSKGEMRDLALATFNQVSRREYKDAALPLWKVIVADTSDQVSIEGLEALMVIGRDNEQVRLYLREWLTVNNGLFKDGIHINKQMIAEMINVLERFEDGDSYSIILESLNLNISYYVSRAAKQALKTLTPFYLDRMKHLLVFAPFDKKESAVETILESKLVNDDKAALLSVALDAALDFIPADKGQRDRNETMRQLITKELTKLASPEATLVGIKNLKKGIAGYENGTETRFFLIEIIDSLASTETEPAAVELTEYLDHLNRLQESGDKVDEKLYIAVIKALGELNDPVALEALRYTEHLDITDTMNIYIRRALRKINR